MWYFSDFQQKTSAVGCIQIYSDNQQISLAASSLKFYPLHVKLLNIRKEKRWMHIVAAETTMAYLSVSLQIKEDASNGTCKVSKLSTYRATQLLHYTSVLSFV